MKVPIGLGPNC